MSRSKSGAEVLVNAAEMERAPWRYGALKLWFDRGGTVMTRGPGVYDINAGRFMPGMKLVEAADGTQSIAAMTRWDYARYVGHDATLSFIGWSPVMPPAIYAGVQLYYHQPEPPRREPPRGR